MGYPADAFVALYTLLPLAGVALVTGILYVVATLLANYRKTTVLNFFELAVIANVLGLGAILFGAASGDAVYSAVIVLVTEFLFVAIPYAIGDVLLDDVPDPAVLGAVPLSLFLSLLAYPSVGTLSLDWGAKAAIVVGIAVIGPTVISKVTWEIRSQL